MKKILIINTTIGKGGAARVASDLFQNLSTDFDMHFAYGRKTGESAGNAFYFGNKLETYLHIFLVRFLGLEGYGSYFSTMKLIRYIQKEKFDLINIHNLHGYYLNFFLLLDFLKKSGIPIVYSLHDEWPITWLPAHSMDCTHCKTGSGQCTNIYSYPKNYFSFFTGYMLARKKSVLFGQQEMIIVCPSLWLKESIKHSFLGKFRIERIFNGIDTDLFRPIYNKKDLRLKYKIPQDKKVVLFSASNLSDKSKGIRYIIESATLLNNNEYYFLGLGEGNIKGSRVRTTGYVYDKKQLAELYALSDVFCFASAAETFLLSAAEALACGVPVVGFDIPVVRELVTKDVGILTDKTSLSLAQNIACLFEDPEHLMKKQQEARKLIEDNYRKDIFYKKYIELYSKCLSND